MFDFAAPSTPLTISFGDQPEALDKVLDIMRDAGALVEVEVAHTGTDIYRREVKEGVLPEDMDSIRRTKLFLKAPTKTPSGDGYIPVMQAFCNKYNTHTRLEYFVCEEAPGVGLVIEEEESRITADMVANIYAASEKLGGRKFAYSIDDLRLAFQAQAKDYPKLSAEIIQDEDIENHFANYDVIFTDSKTAKSLKKSMKIKYGCAIYLGEGNAFFEPLDDYNKNDKGLLLAAALVLKYSGQDDVAWAVYEKLAL